MKKYVTIIKLVKDNDLPDYISIRSKISDKIYTANLSEDEISRVHNDEKIKSYSLAQKLDMID